MDDQNICGFHPSGIWLGGIETVNDQKLLKRNWSNLHGFISYALLKSCK